MFLLPQEGKIDIDRELIDIAVEMDIIKRRGAWYSYGDSKWNGMTAIELSDQERSEVEQLILGKE